MFSYVSAEQRIPTDHPLRAIRQLVDEIPRELSRDFGRLAACTGRSDGPRSRRNGCYARNCCRCSIRSAASAC
jgi:hypothetical protein